MMCSQNHKTQQNRVHISWEVSYWTWCWPVCGRLVEDIFRVDVVVDGHPYWHTLCWYMYIESVGNRRSPCRTPCWLTNTGTLFTVIKSLSLIQLQEHFVAQNSSETRCIDFIILAAHECHSGSYCRVFVRQLVQANNKESSALRVLFSHMD